MVTFFPSYSLATELYSMDSSSIDVKFHILVPSVLMWVPPLKKYVRHAYRMRKTVSLLLPPRGELQVICRKL